VYRTPKEVVRALLRQEKNKQFKGHVDFPHTRTPVLSMVDYSMELYYSKVHESGFEFPFALQKHRDLQSNYKTTKMLGYNFKVTLA
jgi:hypothetical protein